MEILVFLICVGLVVILFPYIMAGFLAMFAICFGAVALVVKGLSALLNR